MLPHSHRSQSSLIWAFEDAEYGLHMRMPCRSSAIPLMPGQPHSRPSISSPQQFSWAPGNDSRSASTLLRLARALYDRT